MKEIISCLARLADKKNELRMVAGIEEAENIYASCVRLSLETQQDVFFWIRMSYMVIVAGDSWRDLHKKYYHPKKMVKK